jgi:endoglucanase Acf2
MMRSTRWISAMWLLAACAPSTLKARSPSAPPDPSQAKAVGGGYYATTAVEGEPLPGNEHGTAVQPKVTADFQGPPTSNDWWSSLIWQFDPGGKPNPYSQPMFAHPLAMQAERGGLAIAYPTQAKVEGRDYAFPFVADLLVGAVGLDAPDARVARYSDWTVTASWGDPALRATFGHGLPFVYVETTGGRAARVEARDAIDVWKLDGEVAAVTVRGHHYALFAPAGSRWTRDGKVLQAGLGDGGFYAVAVLPDREPATLALFRDHAYAFVTGGQVSWEYAAARGEVVSTFHLATTLRQPGRDPKPLAALYRHQWMHSDAAVTGHSYVSPRGQMKLALGDALVTKLPFHGVVPVLPLVDGVDKKQIADLVDEAWRRGNYVPAGPEGKKDSYWTGKAVQRLAILAHLADQVGHVRARDQFVRAIENELEDWFDGRAPNVFFYDAAWHTLIGSPSAYSSGSQLNDHHFHYGYFVFAAATVAHFDPPWAALDRHGAMVELLVRDAANWKRDDAQFPFLRYFDPYAGHSWASGPAMFDRGNNEESSSEDVNFAVGAVLWGAATGNTEVRDLGAFLYANLTTAIPQYWFDVDRAVFPKGYGRAVIAILWGDGGRFETWWDPSPVYAHGINVLPVTGGSLYLGYDADYVRRAWKSLVDSNRGEPLQWRDVLWMYLALADGEGAARRWGDAHRFTPEAGNSAAVVADWIDTLRVTGGPDAEVTADAATALVLRKGSQRTYVGYNPTATALDVRFSDGAKLTVPPRSYAHLRRALQGATR